MRGFLLVLVATAAAAAPNECVLQGRVAVDADTVRPGVAVVLDGAYSVVTDALGGFVFAGLSSGEHTVQAAATVVQVTLRAATTTFVVLTLPSADAGTVLRTGSGAVDIGSPALTTTIGPDLHQRSPFVTPLKEGVRSVESLIDVSPYAVREGSGISLGGGRGDEHSYLMNGLRLNDPLRGGLGLAVPLEFMSEVSAVTGGQPAEFGGSSGSTVMLNLKRGDNAWHGSVWGSLQPGALTANSTKVVDDRTSVVRDSRPINFGDVGFDLAGPLIKDRLWFYAGVSPTFSRVQHIQSLRAYRLTDDGTDTVRSADATLDGTALPESRRTGFTDARTVSSVLNLTWQPHQNHRLSLQGLFGHRLATDGLVPYGQVSGVQRTGQNLATSLSYRGDFSGAFTLEALVGAYLQGQFERALDEGGSLTRARFFERGTTDLAAVAPLSSEQASLCQIPSQPVSVLVRGERRVFQACPFEGMTGGVGTLTSSTAERLSAQLGGTLRVRLLGHHTFKVGATFDWQRAVIDRTTSGGATEVVNAQGQVFTITPSPTSVVSGLAVGTFVHDAWRVIDEVTVSAGLRVDIQQMGNLSLTALSPRLGVVYDYTRQGTGRLFAQYARHALVLPLQTVFTESRVDPAVQAPVTDEFVTGLEYELFRGAVAGVSYTRRWLTGAVTPLASSDGAATFIGTPGTGWASGQLPATRDVDAFVLTFTKRLSGSWSAQGSYTWATVRGSLDSLSAPQGFSVPSAQLNAVGDLSGDRTHTLRLFAAKDIAFNPRFALQVGLGYLGQSGQPISYLARHPVAGLDGTYVFARGEAGRTGFIHTVNARLGASYRFDNAITVTLAGEVFNIFNLQEATQVSSTLSSAQIGAVAPGAQGPRTLQEAACIAGGDTRCLSILVRPDGQGGFTRVSPEELNADFKRPTAYQLPVSARFTLRVTF